MAIAVQPFEGSYKLDENHSSFQFSVTHLGLSTFRACLSPTVATRSAARSRSASTWSW